MKQYIAPNPNSSLYEEILVALAIVQMLDQRINNNDGRLTADSSAYLDYYLDTREELMKLFGIKELK